MVKHLILLFSTVVIFSGCFSTTVVDTRIAETTCPKFPIEKFEDINDYVIKDLKVVTIDGQDYVQVPIESMLGFIDRHQKIKKNYSILRSNLIEFQKGK